MTRQLKLASHTRSASEWHVFDLPCKAKTRHKVGSFSWDSV